MRAKFTVLARAILAHEAAEETLRAKRDRLYESAAVTCYLPGREEPVIMTGQQVRALADQFLIAPSGDHFVPVARAFWNYYAPIYTYPDGSQRKARITWYTIEDPTGGKSLDSAVHEFDYERHGFQFADRSWMAPHDVAFLPTKKDLGWRSINVLYEINH